MYICALNLSALVTSMDFNDITDKKASRGIVLGQLFNALKEEVGSDTSRNVLGRVIENMKAICLRITTSEEYTRAKEIVNEIEESFDELVSELGNIGNEELKSDASRLSSDFEDLQSDVISFAEPNLFEESDELVSQLKTSIKSALESSPLDENERADVKSFVNTL